MQSYVIAAQGFRGSFDEFIPVEVTILSQANVIIKHFILRREEPMFYLPIRAKQTNNWLTKEYHGLHWGQGPNTIADLEEEFEGIGYEAVIYVKGVKQARFLRQYFRDVYEMEEMGCPGLSQLRISGVACWKHVQLGIESLNCSRKNVIALQNWLASHAVQKVDSRREVKADGILPRGRKMSLRIL